MRWCRRRRPPPHARCRWSCGGSGDGAAPAWTAAVCAAAALLAAVAVADDADRVHVVSVRWRTGEACAAKCTGFMMSRRAVLTAASCVGTAVVEPTTTAATRTRKADREEAAYREGGDRVRRDADDGDDDGGGDVNDPEDPATAAVTDTAAATGPTTTRKKYTYSANKTIVKIKSPPNAITVCLHNTEEYSRSDVRMVIDKYVHPDWNPETHVGDLAVLIINKPFSQFKYIRIPNMIGNDRKNMPKVLRFRGFAQIERKPISAFPAYKNGDMGIPDDMARRTLVVEFSPDACPIVEKSIPNPNWWSFLCTKPKFARTEINNTLCNEDIGGPLYALESGRLWLYGVYSHAYHTTYPYCAEQLCYRLKDAPYPCAEGPDSGTYYRHTAVLGRYTSWLRRVIEVYARGSTVVLMRDCPTEPPPEKTTTPDPLYDGDLYDGRRHMVDNHKVCPPRSSGGRAASSVAAAAVVAVVAVASTRW